MKRIILIFCLIATMIAGPAYADTYHRVWVATSATGGGAGSADGAISGVSINANDRLMVITATGEVYFYDVQNSSATENVPYIIAPDDVGAGTTRWHLADVASGVSTLRPIVGGVSIYNLTTSQTLTREMMSGAFIGNYGANSEVTYTLLPAWKGSSFNISLDQDQTSGSTVWVIIPATDKILNENDFATGAVAGCSAFYLSGTTGAGSITFVGKAANKWRTYEEGTVTQKSR